MQVCQLSTAEAERVKDLAFVPDCRFHKHLSKQDAEKAGADGRVKFVSRRAVVALGPVPLSGYWYDHAVYRNDRYLGTAQSGPVRTNQLLKFMPRGMKRRVRDVGACGTHGRLMNVRAVNVRSEQTSPRGNQE